MSILWGLATYNIKRILCSITKNRTSFVKTWKDHWKLLLRERSKVPQRHRVLAFKTVVIKKEG